MTKLLDARGVPIKPDSTVVYGFGVGRSIAMAEGVIEEKDGEVSQTPSGRVWVQIVRRSYSLGTKDRVNVSPDRLVVVEALPVSPMPTQLEKNVDRWKADFTRFSSRLDSLANGGDLLGWENQYHREEVISDYLKWRDDVEKKLKEVGYDG